jgi:hypothetical protein
MNITENNKLIAEFMGMEHCYRPYGDGFMEVKECGSVIELDDLEYHASWEWLMPVVSKVREMYNRCEVGGIENGVNVEEMIEVIAQGCVEVHILQVHKGLIEFIKWYNENK